jgi:superkiller protein 3
MRINTCKQCVATGLLAASVGLLAVGCQSTSNHAKWKKQANQRWHNTRSSLMLDMAQQKFEAGDLEQAKKNVEQGLKIDGDNPHLLLLAGRIALEQGELERSFHLFNKSIGADEKNKLAKPYYYKGVVLQRWQKYDQAHASYKEAYELKPDKVAYLLAMSEMQVQMGNRQKAVALLEEKRSYFDQNSTLRAALAHLYNMQQRHDKAANLFKEASLLDPTNTRLQQELGLAQVAAGRYDAAIDTFRQLFSKHPDAKRADLQRALATAYVETDQLDQAQQTYLALARSDNGEARDWLRLGGLAWQQDDAQGALDAANRVVAQASHNPRGYMLAGMALQKKGRLEAALRMFDQAANHAPDQAQPWILRGLTLQRAGRQTAAAEAYREALERKPDDSQAKRLLQSVNRTHS